MRAAMYAIWTAYSLEKNFLFLHLFQHYLGHMEIVKEDNEMLCAM